MKFKYQNQVDRITFPSCEECLEISALINKDTLYDPAYKTMRCTRNVMCGREFWVFRDNTLSARMAVLALQEADANLSDGAIYHPSTKVATDIIFTILSNVGPTGDTYSYKDIIQPLLFEATADIQDKLIELSTEMIPWLQLDEAAEMMLEIGYMRTIRQNTKKTIYIKHPVGTLRNNLHLAPEHDTGLEFGYGAIQDIAKLPGFSASALYADQAARRPSTKIGDIYQEREPTTVYPMHTKQNAPVPNLIWFEKKES